MSNGGKHERTAHHRERKFRAHFGHEDAHSWARNVAVAGKRAVKAVLRALEVGYRHIDTATAYGNEEQVGQAVAQSGVRREDIFVTTKLPPSRAGRERETFESSLDALAFGYVDLWLIHWPPSGARDRTCGSGFSRCRRKD